MRKLFILILTVLTLHTNGQLLVTVPDFITESSTSVNIIADATFGNKKLLGNTNDVFVHIGVITTLSANSSDWKYVTSVWGNPDVKFKCIALGNSKWSYTINNNLRNFFGVTNPNEKILKC